MSTDILDPVAAAPTTAAQPAPRTSRADRNYYSISRNTYQMYAGTSDPQPGEEPAEYGFTLIPDKPQDWDTVFKFCDFSFGYHLTEVRVAQGSENAMDCNNRAHDSSFSGRFGVGGGTGEQVITTKGGCFNLTWNGVVESGGRNADACIGAWSDQCFDKSHDLDYSGLSHISGRALTFILARCDRKTIKLPPGAKVLFWKSVGWEAYWWLKWAAVKAGLFGKK